MRILDARQKRFFHEYLIDGNAAASAIRAGYAPKCARQQAAKLWAWPEGKAYFAEISEPIKKQLELTGQRVLDELAKIAFNDPGAFYTRDSRKRLKIMDIDKLTPEQRSVIAEYDPVTKRVKLHDKPKSLELLGRHLKLWTDLTESKHTFNIMNDVMVNGQPWRPKVGEEPPKK